MPTPSDEHAARLLRRLDAPSDAAHVEGWLGGLRRKQRRRRVARLGFLTVCVLGMAVLGIVAVPRLSDIERAGVQRNDARVVALVDGSTVERDADARLTIDESQPRDTRVVLESGKLTATVTPRQDRAFTVVAGAFRVVVVGTRFEVERRGEQVRVRVERGAVRVLEANAAPVLLQAGQERLFPEPRTASASRSEPAAVSEEIAAAPSAEPREVAPAADWRSLARRGVYAEAYQLIKKGGPRIVGDEVGDLLLAADAARLSGHPAAALPFLGRLLALHSRDPRAPMAAFTKGRLLMDLDRAAEGAAAFEKALALGAQGSLRENALARAVESRGRAGDGARAASLAHEYVKEYPRGRWLASVRAYGGLDE